MDNIVLVVLTENYWLFAGLTALFPEITCIRLNYDTRRMPTELINAGRIIIAVDSLIFFRGEWHALNSLRNCRVDTSVVWLMRDHTGRVFPANSRGDRILMQSQDIASLGLCIREISNQTAASVNADSVRPVTLTLTELRLLPYFTSGVNLPLLSRRLGCAVKTLYHHRQSILAKAGFRQSVFMEYFYQRNPGFSGIYSPKIQQWKCMWQEQLDDNPRQD